MIARELTAAQVLRANGPATVRVKLAGADTRIARSLFRAAIGTDAVHPSANKPCVAVLRALEKLHCAEPEVELEVELEHAISVGLTMRSLAKTHFAHLMRATQLERVGAAIFDTARAACAPAPEAA